MIYKFNGDITYKVAEALVASYFIRQNFLVKKAAKNLNYDLICTKHNTCPVETLYIEVKFDVKAFSTGNIFWETEVDGEPGWTQIDSESRPDYVYWVFPNELKYLDFNYILSFDFSKYKKKEVNNYSRRIQGATYLSYGYLVPIKDLDFVSVPLISSEGVYQ